MSLKIKYILYLEYWFLSHKLVSISQNTNLIYRFTRILVYTNILQNSLEKQHEDYLV